MADNKPVKKSASVSDIMGGQKSSKETKKSPDSMKSAPAESKPPAKEKAKKKHRHTHIESHDDGSHTVRHAPADGGPEVSYAAKDLDEVHDGLEQHLGDANADEGQEPMQAQAAPQPQPGPQQGM